MKLIEKLILPLGNSEFIKIIAFQQNRIYHEYDPTILFWQDRSVWATSSKDIQKTKSIKVTRKGMVNQKFMPNVVVRIAVV